MTGERCLLIGIGLLALMGTLACSQESVKPEKVVARINNYELTQDEFLRQLSAEVDIAIDFKLTKQTRDQFLDNLDTKE